MPKIVNLQSKIVNPKGVQWTLELMAMTYVAVGVLFLVNPDWIILVVNKAFA
ncbi:MAG: hypothetical protein JRF64_10665, partial [Deltaproteobacteria bacterium]|nr:hypothetical protein [Deltaproteobacteria bacterium]